MFGIVTRRLSVKLTVFLGIVTVLSLGMATAMVVQRESTVVEQLVIQEARTAALAGASAYAAILKTGIDSGALTLAEILDPVYDEIKTVDADGKPITAAEARALLGAPQTVMRPAVRDESKFVDPDGKAITVEDARYYTKYGAYTDVHDIQAIQDAILHSSGNFLYASGMDRRGYVPTPHRKYSELPLGIGTEETRKRDRAVSRGKRMYTGAGQIAAAGFRGTPTQATMVLPYLRDTGQEAWDVVAPIYISGRHWGGFRVGVSRDQIAAQSRDLLIGLGLLFSVSAVAIVGLLFWLSARYLRPLRRMSEVVTAMSIGEADLSEKVEPSQDQTEVGALARAINRLRLSLRGAIQLVDAATKSREVRNASSVATDATQLVREAKA